MSRSVESKSAPMLSTIPENDEQQFAAGKKLDEVDWKTVYPLPGSMRNEVEGYVWPYEPSIPKVRYYEMVVEPRIQAGYPHDAVERFLIRKGYPKHVAHSICSPEFGKRATQLKEIVNRRVEGATSRKEYVGKSAKAVKPTSFAKGTGLNKEFWRIPNRPNALEISKPEVRVWKDWNPTHFRRWVEGAANVLNRKVQGDEKKKMFATGNESCFTLYHCTTFPGTLTQLQKCIRDAQVYIADYDYNGNAPASKTFPAGQAMKKIGPTFKFGPLLISSLDILIDNQELFSGNQPVFKLMKRAFFMDDTVNIAQVQSILDKIWAKENGFVKGKRRYQGQGPSISLKHDLPRSQDVSEFFDGFVKSVGSRLPDGLALKIFRFFAFLFTINNCDNWRAALGGATLYASTIPGLPEKLGDLLRGVEPRAYQGSTLSSEDADVPKLGQGINMVGPSESESWRARFIEAGICSGVFTIISETMSGISEYFSPFVRSAAATLRVAIMREGASNIAKTIIDAVIEIFRRIKDCWSTKSFAPIWGKDYDPKAWAKSVQTMMTYHMTMVCIKESDPLGADNLEKLRKSGVIDDYWTHPVSNDVFVERARDLLEKGNTMISYFSGNPLIVRDLRVLHSRFHSFIELIEQQQVKSNFRVCPFFIFCEGAPGGGKTTVTNDFLKSVANRWGFNFDTGIYPWQTATNFQSGLNQTIWWITADDIDTSTAPLSASVANACQIDMMIVNNNPMPVEESDNNMKGRSYANPLGYIRMSNFEDGRVRDYSLRPLAWYRRVSLRTRLEAKPEYAVGEHKALDRNKAKYSLVHDMYDIYVSHFDEKLWHNGMTGMPFGPETKMSMTEYTIYAQDLFAKHLAAQQKLLLQKSSNGPYCPKCFLSSTRKCSCESIGVPEGDKIPLNVVSSIKAEAYNEVIDNYNRIRGDIDGYARLDVDNLGRPMINFEEFAEGVDNRSEIGDASMRPLTLRRQTAARGVHYQGATISVVKQYYSFMDNLFKNIYYNTIGHFRSWVPNYSPTFEELSESLQSGVEAFNEHFYRNMAFLGAILGTIYVGLKIGRNHVVKHYQARENNGTGAPIMNWVRAEQKYTPGLPNTSYSSTFTYDELVAAIQGARVVVEQDTRRLSGMLVSHNLLLYPAHIIKDEHWNKPVAFTGQKVNVVFPEKTVTFEVTDYNTVRLPGNQHLLLTRCGDLKPTSKLVGKFWTHRDKGVVSFDAVEVVGRKAILPTTRNMIVKDGMNLAIISDAPTQDGDCGDVYIAKFNSSWRAIGMHIMTVGIDTMGAVVTGHEIELCAQVIGTRYQAVSIPKSLYTTGELPPYCEHMPEKSEVQAAVTFHGATPFCAGELHPPLKGSTVKTRIVEAKTFPYFKEFIDRHCGGENYFALPTFKGAMVNGKWVSLYTDAFRTENKVHFREEIMAMAMYDYLSGIKDLDPTGFRVISETEALAGVPRTDINATNMSTSFGPPYNTSKKKHYAIVDHDEVYMSPEANKMANDIDVLLDLDNIVGCVGIAAPKDEPVKPGKMPRLFTVLPAVFNTEIKKNFAPIKLFMRAFRTFFESAVGINMTSSECNEAVVALSAVNAELDRIFDSDAEKLDKSWSGNWYDAVAIVFALIGHYLGGDRNRVYSLVQGLKCTITSFKNDLVFTFHNHSGCDITVELNDKQMQLGFRYVFFNARYPTLASVPSFVLEWYRGIFTSPDPFPSIPLPIKFRDNIVLETFGDDALHSRKKGCEIEEDFVEVWRNHLGVRMTAGDKSATIKPQKISEVVFLKRKFVWDEELKQYIPPLDLRSIGRMLKFKKESYLTLPDHACVTITEAYRELAYHKREIFDEYDAIAKRFVNEEGLLGNPYLKILDYDEARKMMKEGNFQTWIVRDPAEVQQSASLYLFGIDEPNERKRVYQSETKMSNNLNVDGANGAPVVMKEASALGESLTGNQEIGGISTDVQAMVGLSPGEQKFTQKLGAGDLGAFTQRYTLLQKVPISNGNAVLSSVVAPIDVWQLLLASVPIADKFKNFAYVRGSVDIMVVPQMPGNACGLYWLHALPNPATYEAATTAFAPVSVPPALLACNPTVNFPIDCAACQNIFFTLPYLWPTDFAPLPIGPQGSWLLNVYSIASIQTGIPGGVTTGSIAIYAKFNADLELTIGKYQSEEIRADEDYEDDLLSINLENYVIHYQAMSVAKKKPSTYVQQAADTLKAIEFTPMIGSYASAASNIAGATAKMMSMFGYTRENKPEATEFCKIRGTANTANVDGIDHADVVALTEDNAISIDPKINSDSTGVDEMAFSELFKHWTIVAQFGWNSGGTGTIATVPVAPLYTKSTLNTWRFTTGGYIGIPFQKWRGDMEYRVFVSASVLHRGTLQVSWIPEDSAAPNLDPTNVVYNQIVDVNGPTTFDMKVGYSSYEPMLENEIIYDALNLLPLGCKNGTIYFNVVNPLQAPNTGALVYVTVLARCCENMQFAQPRGGMCMPTAANNFNGVPWTFVNNARYQSVKTDTDQASAFEPMSFELVPSSGEYPMAELFNGEDIRSVRALVQKPERVIQDVAAAGVPIYAAFLRSIPNNSDAGSTVEWTMQCHYRQLFACVATSEKYKVMPTGGTAQWLGISPVWNALTPTVFPQLGDIQYLSATDQAVEKVIPYYGNCKFVPGYYNYINTNAYSNKAPRRVAFSLFNNIGTYFSGATKSICYYSLGADVRMTQYRVLPTFITNTSQGVAPTQFF